MQSAAVPNWTSESGVKMDSSSAADIEVDDNDDILDDNNMERILSRPAKGRRRLALFEAPEFTERLRNYQEATVGDTVTFSGRYKAFPKPTVKWFKDEEEVTETTRHCIDLSCESEGFVRLIIHEVIRKDEGAYKCKVENHEGVASTTGYLSVTGKASDKTHSLQTRKFGQDRVSTPPYLRPIAEQKSMEEREEKEYQCLPPSPLQEFMDRIRHSAKSMHGPIIYADLAALYADDDLINDFDETSSTGEDVFDESEQSSGTPSASPVEDILIEDALGLNKSQCLSKPTFTDSKEPSIHVVDEFISPSVDLRAPAAGRQTLSTQTLNEDNAHDSDGGQEKNKIDSDPTQSILARRRLQLSILRSSAVEIADVVVSPSETLQTTEHIDQKTSPASGQIEPSASTGSTTEITDLVFRWVDSPWMQFFTSFITAVTAIALAFDLPPAYLVVAVLLISLASFQILDLHQNTV